jgi:hypothetical protein
MNYITFLDKKNEIKRFLHSAINGLSVEMTIRWVMLCRRRLANMYIDFFSPSPTLTPKLTVISTPDKGRWSNLYNTCFRINSISEINTFLIYYLLTKKLFNYYGF